MSLPKVSCLLPTVTAIAGLHAMAGAALAQQPAEPPRSSRYICTALERAGGHEEPALTSPPVRVDDGRLRIMEQDEKAYASWAGENVPEWLALYTQQDGNSGSFIGHFPSDSFKCQAILGQ